MNRISRLLAIAFVTGTATASLAQQPLGTGFTYQGLLKQNGQPVSGTPNLSFSLHDAPAFGNQIGSPELFLSQGVNNGLFTVVLNAAGEFGPMAFTGDRRWLEISVNGAPLSPRQELTASGYALFAAGPWKAGGTSLFYTGGNVGIGTSTPQAPLHVAEGTSGLGISLPGLRVIQSSESPNVLGGFNGNTVVSGVVGATIAGGGSSGFLNKVFDRYGTVGGGEDNWVGTDDGDPTSSGFATVAGGADNRANGANSSIGGGELNAATGHYSTVIGGSSNIASGSISTVAGGAGNVAAGDQSFAAGRRAKANHTGSFVWADDSNAAADVASNADNQWTARCAGGVRFYTDASLTLGAVLNPGSGSWASASDRNLKENIAPIDSQQILACLGTLPISTWNYKAQETTVRHIGPMAQDFYSAFAVGEDDRHITAVDADGVALAAIQALNQNLQAQSRRLEALEGENVRLHAQLDQLLHASDKVEASERAPSTQSSRSTP